MMNKRILTSILWTLPMAALLASCEETASGLISASGDNRISVAPRFASGVKIPDSTKTVTGSLVSKSDSKTYKATDLTYKGSKDTLKFSAIPGDSGYTLTILGHNASKIIWGADTTVPTAATSVTLGSIYKVSDIKSPTQALITKTSSGLTLNTATLALSSTTKLYYSVNGAAAQEYSSTTGITASAGSIIKVWVVVTKDSYSIASDTLSYTYSAASQFKLTVSAENGSVTLSPAGGTYDSNTVVSATAVADSGYSFQSWGGACTGTDASSCSVTMTANKTLSAAFVAKAKHTFTGAVDDTAHGTINPLTASYSEGTKFTVTATPKTGWVFKDWTGVNSSSNPLTFTMPDSDVTVTANFAKDITYQLNTKATNGSVSRSPDSTNGYHAKTVVALTASPDSGYVFDHWTGCSDSTKNPCSVTMTGKDTTVTAVFARDTTYKIVIKAEHGSVTRSPDSTGYHVGTSVTLKAVADSGYNFDSWTGCNATSATCVLTMARAKDTTVTATFVKDTSYKLNVNILPSSAAATVTYTGDSTSYHAGTEVKLVATAASSNYTFSKWTGCTKSSGSTCYITMGKKDTTLTVTFVKDTTYKLTATADSGTVTVTPDSSAKGYHTGTTVTVTAKAKTGYLFSSWTGCTASSSTDTTSTCKIVMGTSDTAVKANFKVNASVALKTLTVSSGTLSPKFDSATTSYTVGVSATASQDTISAAAVFGTVTGAGKITLSSDTTEATVTVTNSNTGSTRDYTIKFVKSARTATLASLTASAGTLTPTFAAATQTYYDTALPSATTSLKLTVTTTEDDAVITATNGTVSGKVITVTPDSVDKVVTITVTSGVVTKDYIVHVKKLTSSQENTITLTATTKSLSAGVYTVTYSSSACTNHIIFQCNGGCTVSVDGTQIYSGTAYEYSASTSISALPSGSTMTVTGNGLQSFGCANY